MSNEAITPVVAPEAAWPVLFLVRRGVVPEGDFLGWVVEIPPEPLSTAQRKGWAFAHASEVPSGAPALDAVLDAMGFPSRFVGIGAPARLVAWGLVEPSVWESAVVNWVERRLARKAESQPARPTFAAVDATIGQVADSFLDPFLAVRPGVNPPLRLIEGGDPELEAMGVARVLRERLLAEDPRDWPSWFDGVRVLVPAGGSRVATWRHSLERAGFPVLPVERRSLADTGIARWLVRRLDLASWSELPLPFGAREK